MNTFVPLEYYQTFYYSVVLVMVSLVYLNSLKSDFQEKKIFGIVFLLFVLFYIGLRPISFVFVDMGIYNRLFESYQLGEPFDSDKDVFFDYFIYLSSKVMTAEFFFLICACLYVIPLYSASKRIFQEYWFYGFLILVASLSFWAYGVNGIRNGIATSLFLYAISFTNKRNIIILLILTTFIHKSLMLPCLAYLLSNFYTDTKKYLIFWFTCIPVSLALGSVLSTFFLSLGLVEESRIAGYFDENDEALEDSLLKVGFRWDFLLYSATGVFAGYYFIIKKGFKDAYYSKIYNTYLISNSIWILVISANFSNRFAYLSWFMLGLVIIYPFLKMKFFHNQHELTSRIIFIYYLFTFIMGVIFV